MQRAHKDMRHIELASGERLAVEHVTGYVTSIWPGRHKTTWIEVRQRDGHDRLCHALVPLPLEEHQRDEVSFALGGPDGDTVLAWKLWRSGEGGVLPGLFRASTRETPLRALDPGLVGVALFKAFAKVPARVTQAEADLASRLQALLAAVRARVAPTPRATA